MYRRHVLRRLIPACRGGRRRRRSRDIEAIRSSLTWDIDDSKWIAATLGKVLQYITREAKTNYISPGTTAYPLPHASARALDHLDCDAAVKISSVHPCNCLHRSTTSNPRALSPTWLGAEVDQHPTPVRPPCARMRESPRGRWRSECRRTVPGGGINCSRRIGRAVPVAVAQSPATEQDI